MHRALYCSSILRLLRVPVCAGALALLVLVLLAGFVPGHTGGELRLPLGLWMERPNDRVLTRPLDTTSWMLRAPVSTALDEIAGGLGDSADMTPDAITQTSSARSDVSSSAGGMQAGVSVAMPNVAGNAEANAVAGAVSGFAAGTGVGTGSARQARVTHWVAFAEHGVNVLTARGPRLLSSGLEGADLFQRLSRKGQGMPTGVSLRATAQTGAAQCIPLPDNVEPDVMLWQFGGRMPFSATVEQYARRFKLDSDLIYAIMFTESGFNTRAVSNRDAYGLMQVVPGSAGNEVHAYLHGRPGQPDARTLLNPETNIQYGITYYYLLLKRHMNGIVDPLSREYCAVAAYNMGPNGLLRVFGPTRDAAFAAINALTSSEVYAALQARLPSKETRQFLNRVMSVRSRYAFAE